MEQDVRYGTPWRSEELDVIVADYFNMLSADLAGQPYVKARHSAQLMTQLSRSHRSVEFKHQNISAVLEVLGLPWIPGYIPKINYQNAIFEAIDRYLDQNGNILSFSRNQSIPTLEAESSFVKAPTYVRSKDRVPDRLKRFIRKFDPVERDRRNHSLGRLGEIFVLEVERQRLEKRQRLDLAGQVRWISEEDGDGAGYDILSFDDSGRERKIEVKTTNGASRTPFFLSRNERQTAEENPSSWSIYRVHLFATTPRIFILAPPLEDGLLLQPETWRASF